MVTKIVSFYGPYIGKTFQTQAQALVGGDGYLSGGAASDDGVNITLAAYSFVQAGIICTDTAPPAVACPAGGTPWFVIASTFDDDPNSGIILSVVTDPAQVVNAVVIAYKMNGTWYSPFGVSSIGAEQHDAPEGGVEHGFALVPTLDGGSNATALGVGRGMAIDGNGDRRELVGPAATPGVAASLAAAGASSAYSRNDYAVLRKREVGTELVLVKGNAQSAADTSLGGSAVALETGAGVKIPHSYAKPGADGRIAAAWGNGTNLRGYASGIVTGFSFAATTLYAGAATIDNTFVAGQRKSDNALIVLFTEGNDLKAMAVNASTGASIDAPHIIDTQPNAIINVRAAIDGDEKLHVVYQHNEGGAPPNQQIYYTKISLVTGASWATALLVPRLVNGANSTKNDTWPSIGVDRKRRAHIAYATGNSSDQFGQLRYSIIDEAGNSVSRTTYATYGYQPSTAQGVVPTPGGYVSYISLPRVLVTCHDEVFIVVALKRTAGTNPDDVAIFSPQMFGRFKFDILILSSLYPASGAGTDTINFINAMADDAGQFIIATAWNSAGVLMARLAPTLAPDGDISASYLEQPSISISGGVVLTAMFHASQGPCGELLLSFLNGTVATVFAAPSRVAGGAFLPHRDDTFLAGWKVDTLVAVAAIDKIAKGDYEIFSTRQKRMSYPVLVGHLGDYQGHGSLVEALAAAAVRIGGKIVLRGGYHRINQPLIGGTGVSIEAESHAVLDFTNVAGVTNLRFGLAALAGLQACTFASGVVALSAFTGDIRKVARVGDVVETYYSGASQGPFRIIRFLDATHFLIDMQGAPLNAPDHVKIYSCGNTLRNLSIIAGSVASNGGLYLETCYGPMIDTVKFLPSAATPGMLEANCREALIRNVDVSGVRGGAAFGLKMTGGYSNLVQDCVFGGAVGPHLDIFGDEVSPMVRGCTGFDGSAALFNIRAGASAIEWVNNIGVVKSGGAPARLGTDVGLTLRGPLRQSGGDPALGGLGFYDDNLDHAAAAALVLTAAAGGTQFNGATPTVILDSVNERVKKTGDVMSGLLELQAGLEIDSMADPSSPAPGKAILYLRVNSAGVHELAIMTSDGNIMSLATFAV